MKDYNKAYFQNIYKERGLLPHEIGCELCHVMSGITFDRHHIVFKSEMGFHAEINNPLNVIQICRKCHDRLHSKKSNRDSIVKKRGLEELFGKKLIYETND